MGVDNEKSTCNAEELIKRVKHRGGPRPGAGRPKKFEEDMATVSFYVAKTTKDAVDELKERGFDVTSLFESFIKNTINSLRPVGKR